MTWPDAAVVIVAIIVCGLVVLAWIMPSRGPRR